MLRHGFKKRRTAPSSHPHAKCSFSDDGGLTRHGTCPPGRKSDAGPCPWPRISPCACQDTRHCSLCHSQCSISCKRRTCFVDCALEEAEKRDPKGLYKKARAGEIKNFTGIDDPYEAPAAPEIHLHTDQMSLEQEVDLLIAYMQERGILAA